MSRLSTVMLGLVVVLAASTPETAATGDLLLQHTINKLDLINQALDEVRELVENAIGVGGDDDADAESEPDDDDDNLIDFIVGNRDEDEEQQFRIDSELLIQASSKRSSISSTTTEEQEGGAMEKDEKSSAGGDESEEGKEADTVPEDKGDGGMGEDMPAEAMQETDGQAEGAADGGDDPAAESQSRRRRSYPAQGGGHRATRYRPH